jgi:2-amino-4-hydroxy-6-hydroxymethyldihydropteridine diphosphokinase
VTDSPAHGFARALAGDGVPFAVALGASLGEPERALALAVRALDALPDLFLTGRSRIYRTPPFGGVARRSFLNAVVTGHTRLTPEDLLRACQAIEQRLGRRAARRWADRALDMDVLLVGDAVRTEPWLTLPHPRMHTRDFVLVPLAEAWIDAADPRTGARYATLPCAGARLPAVGVLPGRRPDGCGGARGDVRVASASPCRAEPREPR